MNDVVVGRRLLTAQVLPRAAAVAAFVVGVVLRPDAAAGLVVLGAVFVVLERRFPLRPQRIFRKGFATDCVHFLADELLAAALLVMSLWMLVPIIERVVPDVVPSIVRSQPTPLALLEAFMIVEISGYWEHRLTHQIPFLWRFHQLHHSIETMDWLAPNRRHPVDMSLARLSGILPLAILGFGLPTIGVHFAVKRFQGLLVHANVKLNAGLLTWVIATPEFHHWHHADDPPARNKNFAGQLPLVDLVFGTLYLPHPAWPTRYGCGATAPQGYVAQLMWPFRSHTTTSTRSSLEAAPTPLTVKRQGVKSLDRTIGRGGRQAHAALAADVAAVLRPTARGRARPQCPQAPAPPRRCSCDALLVPPTACQYHSSG